MIASNVQYYPVITNQEVNGALLYISHTQSNSFNYLKRFDLDGYCCSIPNHGTISSEFTRNVFADLWERLTTLATVLSYLNIHSLGITLR